MSAEKPTSPPFDGSRFLRTLTAKPGVYRMLDDAGQILYIGKAKNLKKRVSSYFRKSETLAPKTRALVLNTRGMEVTVTHTETEALLLESNLIKEYLPRFNILFRDDKSFPYIYLSTEQSYPGLGFHRGSKRKAGRYFGPFPSSAAVRESLGLLQKLFHVRQCEDSFFQNRSRPCLQHQIKRCSGPCTGEISESAYSEDVRHTQMFLEGRSQRVGKELVDRMEAAASVLDFEQAARYRDQIAWLKQIQARQHVSGIRGAGECDVIAAHHEHGAAVVEVCFIRRGERLGNKAYFPRRATEASNADLLQAFLSQYYLASRPVPREILVSSDFPGLGALAEILSKRCKHRVRIAYRLRGERARWLQMAEENARFALRQHLAGKESIQQRLEKLQLALGLEAMPERLECFDISHTQGEATVASCVVFGGDGPRKEDYRKFNIDGITPGDDYAAMHQALRRRYSRIQQSEEARLPDIIIVDGGKGQLSQALAVMAELGLHDVTLLGVVKGLGRKASLDSLILPGSKAPLILPPESGALHLVQQIRDEAHRFAISGHRARRAKKRMRSVLEDIPGVGSKRRQNLLRAFGGLQGVCGAGIEDLAAVDGISTQLAGSIYEHFHGNE